MTTLLTLGHHPLRIIVEYANCFYVNKQLNYLTEKFGTIKFTINGFSSDITWHLEEKDYVYLKKVAGSLCELAAIKSTKYKRIDQIFIQNICCSLVPENTKNLFIHKDGSLPENINELHMLKKLYLKDAYLSFDSYTLKSIYNLKSLKSLHLDVRGDMINIHDLPELEHLYLSSKTISGFTAQDIYISSLSKLKSIKIGTLAICGLTVSAVNEKRVYIQEINPDIEIIDLYDKNVVYGNDRYDIDLSELFSNSPVAEFKHLKYLSVITDSLDPKLLKYLETHKSSEGYTSVYTTKSNYRYLYSSN